MPMFIREVHDRNESLVDELLVIWERSVRATHAFLSDAEVRRIKGYVPQAIEAVEHLVIAESDGPDGEKPVAFMGIQSDRLEMLFVSPEYRGGGIGKWLLQHGIEGYGVAELTVNEQNPQAIGFYEHIGFVAYKRSNRDEEGGPYPILYMHRAGQCLGLG
ncbi:GNAT family N-acetyltransferase [Paratractidigestivibacter sp.]|uniref:GNAT family N-acetyltransferase n=2 Tax=Paratractidigestivibacter sp. TaxID=2847316 RepID=UPI002ABD7023|nr:GNAT family N-acetyltransferase [Paratractidigestivibacter sp.]